MECNFEGCERETHARGVCFTHYVQLRRGRDLTAIGNSGAAKGVCDVPGCQEPSKFIACKRHSQWAADIKRKYSLTIEQYYKMYDEQDGLCKSCKEEPCEVIDHSHVTGEVRALLCQGCNKGMGCFKENPKRLLAAIYYLETL